MSLGSHASAAFHACELACCNLAAHAVESRMLRSRLCELLVEAGKHLQHDRVRQPGVLAAVPGVTNIAGLEAGLHALVDLDPALPAADIVRAAAARGLRIADLDEFRE